MWVHLSDSYSLDETGSCNKTMIPNTAANLQQNGLKKKNNQSDTMNQSKAGPQPDWTVVVGPLKSCVETTVWRTQWMKQRCTEEWDNFPPQETANTKQRTISSSYCCGSTSNLVLIINNSGNVMLFFTQGCISLILRPGKDHMTYLFNSYHVLTHKTLERGCAYFFTCLYFTDLAIFY